MLKKFVRQVGSIYKIIQGHACTLIQSIKIFTDIEVTILHLIWLNLRHFIS